MDAEKWRVIRELFEQSLELPSGQRRSFLTQKAGCPEIAAEVENLICNHEEVQDDFLDPPAAVRLLHNARQALQPGKRVAGRFDVLSLIARGGMGEIYKAFDIDLNEPVALKAISPELDRDPQACARLMRELQLARRVSHRNVCRLFDLVRHTADGRDSILISMELIRGETMEARLEKGELITRDEFALIVTQIIEGLSAAHAAGIVHRDLKPSNIMVAEDRVVIMDFGVARADLPSVSGAITMRNQIVGTPDYMAPEVLRGGVATIASDTYAFGVLLDKLLERTAEADQRWPRIARQCQHIDPHQRPKLGAVSRELKKTTFPRRAIISVAAAIFILSLFYTVSRWYMQGARLQPGAYVYVVDMNNATHDPVLDSVGGLLQRHLSQSPHLRLVDKAKVARAVSLLSGNNTPAQAREIGMRAGAALVVFSTLVSVADTYNLIVEVDQVGSGPLESGRRWRRDWRVSGKQQIFNAVKESGDWIRSVAGESNAAIAQADYPPEEASSGSWEALRLYREAELLRFKGDPTGAVALLNHAVRTDPDFALAHMSLGDILSGIRRQEESFEHYRLALEAASKRRLLKWEELRLRGEYSFDIGDYGVAESAFTELRALYPQDYRAPHYLAGVFRQQGRMDDAIRLENEAAAKAPEMSQPLVILAGIHIGLGNLDLAQVYVGKLRNLKEDALSDEYEGAIRFLRGDWEGARARFEGLTRATSSVRRSHGFSLLGSLLSERGEYQLAGTTYQSGITSDVKAGMPAQAAIKHVALASLKLREGELSMARNHALEAVRLARSIEIYRRSGTILARAGFVADAAKILRELGPTWPGPFAAAARHQIRGEILLSAGKNTRAVEDLESADRIDSPLRVREYLARGYEMAGDRDRALFLYESLMRAQGRFWEYADCEIPGLRASLLVRVAQLLRAAGYLERAEAVLREYFAIRPYGDPLMRETAIATTLLASSKTAITVKKGVIK